MALYGDDMGRRMYDQEYVLLVGTHASLARTSRWRCAQVRHEERILEIEAEPDAACTQGLGLGRARTTPRSGGGRCTAGRLFILDHYAAVGVGVEHYAEIIESKHKQHGWRDGVDWVPHDAKVKEWGSGKTRVETMEQLGLNPSWCRWRRSRTASTPRAARCHCVCFIRGREETGFAALEQYQTRMG